MNKYNILLIEDSDDDISIISEVLSDNNISSELFICKDSVGFKDLISNKVNYNIIISDYYLYNSETVENILPLYNKYSLTNIPFLVMSSHATVKMAIDIMKKGASDFLFKKDIELLPEKIEELIKQYESKNGRINELLLKFNSLSWKNN